MARDKVFLSYRRDDARHIAEVRSAVHAAGYEDVDAPVEAIRLGERATTTRIDLHTKANDVMAPDAAVFALMADQEAIAGQNIKAKTDAHNVVGDRVAIVGAVLTGKRTWKP